MYKGSPERIVGILHHKDLIRLWLERKMAWERKRPSVRSGMAECYPRKPLVVPETKPLPQLLAISVRRTRTWRW